MITSCSSRQETTEPDPQQLRNHVPATEVQTEPVRAATFEYLIHATGKVQAKADIELQVQTGGIIEKVWIQNGTTVKQGQTVITLLNTQQGLALEKARLQLQEREIVYRDAMLGYTQTDSIQLNQVKQNIRISSGLAAAEIAFKEAQLAWEQTIIKAPVSGLVSNLEVQAGGALIANQTVCRIHSAAELVVAAELLEADALLLKPGMAAELKVVGTEKGILASVYQINPRVDEKTNLIKILLNVSAAKRLLPGMTVQLILKVPREKVIVVPREAVVIRSGRQVVFTFENGLAKWNYVTVGNENGKEVEILGGLAEGQQVIVTNNLQLAHDAIVTNK
ncbi:MAG: efflux RND transporter periplasmic adaptor subunit [Cyclobacteriaceae bacterium]|nr:efflux RND transporter periplasmic adaptor subunit [Cyclobacteriaceae bacterium]